MGPRGVGGENHWFDVKIAGSPFYLPGGGVIDCGLGFLSGFFITAAFPLVKIPPRLAAKNGEKV